MGRRHLIIHMFYVYVATIFLVGTELVACISGPVEDTPCNYTDLNIHTKGSVTRASTEACKDRLLYAGCHMAKKDFFPPTLPNLCERDKPEEFAEFVGCFRHNYDQGRPTLRKTSIDLTDNTPVKCATFCYKIGTSLSGLYAGTGCYCGYPEHIDEAEPAPLEMCLASSCPKNHTLGCGGIHGIAVYKTGLHRLNEETGFTYVHPNKVRDPPVKILYLFVITGRAVRHLRRALNLFYSPDHFYYIHVDTRSDYLYRELLKLEDIVPNIRLKRDRHQVTWGGATYMHVVLDSVREIKSTLKWDWDFLANICETSLPVLTTEELTAFLTTHRRKNFILFGEFWTDDFIKTWGLDLLFYECEDRMWLLGTKEWPAKTRAYGGQNWFIMGRRFMEYVTFSSDPLNMGLKRYLNHTIIPLETYFHVALANSPFCGTIGSTHLRHINSNKYNPCHQDNIDWCAGKPNSYLTHHWSVLNRHAAIEAPVYYIARKFDPTMNQEIVGKVEDSVLLASWTSAYTQEDDHASAQLASNQARILARQQLPGYFSYWLNNFDYQDTKKEVQSKMVLMQTLARLSLKDILAFVCPFDTLQPKQCLPDDKKGPKTNPFCHPRCPICSRNPNPKILTSHIYRHKDTETGILIMYSVELVRHGKRYLMTVETMFKKRHRQAIAGQTRYDRLIHVEVNNGYDRTERIFRNPTGLIAVSDTPMVRHEWKAGTPLLVSLVWIDPFGRFRGNTTAAVGQEATSSTAEFPDVPNSRYPGYIYPAGIWTLEVHDIFSHRILGRTQFLVLPETTLKPRKIAPLDVWHQPKPAFDQSELLLRDSPESLVYPMEPNWFEFPAQIAQQFYSPVQRCNAVEFDATLEDTKNSRATVFDSIYLPRWLPLCSKTSWSSLAPDPKSEFDPDLREVGSVSSGDLNYYI